MNTKKKLCTILIFNLFIMTLEIFGSFFSGSLSLFSDAGHMLTDSIAIFLSYLALVFAEKKATNQKTFGYYRTEILAALANGILLFFVAIYIFYQAITRFINPVGIKVDMLFVISIIGFLGNIFAIFFIKKESSKNLNIRGAFFHLISDTISSLGVIIGAILIKLTNWFVIDSLIGLLIGGIVIHSAISLIFEASEILLESTPKDIDIVSLQKEIENIPKIKNFHDIHIWTLSSNKRALSGHILLENISISESQEILCTIKKILQEKFNIIHSTIEVECNLCKTNFCSFNNEKDNTNSKKIF